MCDSVNEFESKICELLIWVDKGFEESKFWVDSFSALREDISFENDLLYFVDPNLLDK